MKTYLLFFYFLLSGCASSPSASAQQVYQPCQQDKVRLEERSNELQKIVNADQDDRNNWNKKTPEQFSEVQKRDEARRKRVGEIFGEGCFSTAEDYAAAAMVYQHGEMPDHYFQTFIWSKRAVELGDIKQKRLMALGIDRYLVSRGHKQLFGSQATRPGPTEATCWCLQQVEKSFPDQRRKNEADKSLTEALNWLKELNNGKNCPNTECDIELKPTPKGTFPGYW